MPSSSRLHTRTASRYIDQPSARQWNSSRRGSLMDHSIPYLRCDGQPTGHRAAQDQLAHHLRKHIPKAKAHAERGAHTYKRYYERAARVPPNNRKGDQVYVLRTQSYALASEERENDAQRTNLLRRSVSPLRITVLRGDVVMINQNGVWCPVSIYRATPLQAKRTRG